MALLLALTPSAASARSAQPAPQRAGASYVLIDLSQQRLYDPSYFTGGYAIRGSPSVPAGPVSHGCVRIPMGAAIPFFQRNPVARP